MGKLTRFDETPTTNSRPDSHLRHIMDFDMPDCDHPSLMVNVQESVISCNTCHKEWKNYLGGSQ